MGTDDSALDAVIAADVELMELKAEEADIQSRLNAVSLDEKPSGGDEEPQPTTSAANDADNDRLAEIYDRLAVSATPCMQALMTMIFQNGRFFRRSCLRP